MELGEKMALARKTLPNPLTQGDLAVLIGVKESTISGYESANHIPLVRVRAIVNALNVSEEWLFDETIETPPNRNDLSPRSMEGDLPVRAKSTEEMTQAERAMISTPWIELPLWRGVSAGGTEELVFHDSDSEEFERVPAFLIASKSAEYVLVAVSGFSMEPRIEHTGRAVVRLGPDVPVDHLVIARSPDNLNYIKILRRGPRGASELHSINEKYEPIVSTMDWTLKGGIVAILNPYRRSKGHIEWDNGRFLAADP